MEKALIKMARQLLAYDEASLTALWDKFAGIVQGFEPTKRWEESVVAFGIIQTVRWKNQLFNYHWKEGRRPPAPEDLPPSGPSGFPSPSGRASHLGHGDRRDKGGKLLRFRPREGDEPV